MQDRPDIQLMYFNMVICCPGNLNNEFHCDTLKNGNSVSFDLLNSELEKSIKYFPKDGKIESSNLKWDSEINTLLNLNHLLLKYNRKETLSGILKSIETKGWDRTSLNRNLKKWRTFDSQGKLKPFCGIVIWYLQKKLKQL